MIEVNKNTVNLLIKWFGLLWILATLLLVLMLPQIFSGDRQDGRQQNRQTVDAGHYSAEGSAAMTAARQV